ncbi:MAG: hypothetical protein COT59_00860 [Candidatus Nealsonbacteria bacterium CG09_land_8_20_14_0_10_42_14]|uniref:Uncharacterized protein n=1 Tax=Candidatus Nealsonbacteria bacterium CG09_land_8_20_14_0_10_42_14 TaxID=1974707 RepID=A0A2H0WZM8_9BACT|nr:MAG: hypothetical protein COT59_00860 [Candidatus Nealsonbacteria bacterium CG09_land_8_20_14_0_10_42_14]
MFGKKQFLLLNDMQKQISSKIIALTFGVLTLVFLAAFYVVAWQEPTEAPPGGNVPTPLNVGNVGQEKVGGLILNTGGAEYGLIIDQGEVCIGDDCRDAWPEAGIGIPSGMIAMFDTSCPSGWTRFAALDDRFPRGASSYGGTGGSATHSHSVNPPATRTSTEDKPGCWAEGIRCLYGGEAATKGHTHDVDIPVFESGTASNLPPYVDVIWCKKD